MSSDLYLPDHIKKLRAGGPADENEQEDWYEEQLEKYVKNISIDYKNAKKVTELNDIIKKYSIKVIKDGKPSSCMNLNKELKKRIIEFTTHEPEDIFDYSQYIRSLLGKNSGK